MIVGFRFQQQAENLQALTDKDFSKDRYSSQNNHTRFIWLLRKSLELVPEEEPGVQDRLL